MLAKLEAHSNCENLRGFTLQSQAHVCVYRFYFRSSQHSTPSQAAVVPAASAWAPRRTRACVRGLSSLARRERLGCCLGLFPLGQPGLSRRVLQDESTADHYMKGADRTWPPSCSTTTGWRRRYVLAGVCGLLDAAQGVSLGTHWGCWMNRGPGFSWDTSQPMEQKRWGSWRHSTHLLCEQLASGSAVGMCRRVLMKTVLCW